MQKTKIEWSETSWNPVRGCSRVSEGCRQCYAERLAGRFCSDTYAQNPFVKKTISPPFVGFVDPKTKMWTGKVELIESKLLEPLHMKKPRRVFVNSMSDLFHENLANSAIDRIFHVMQTARLNIFLVLTKRPKRMYEWWTEHRTLVSHPLPNVDLGISAEDQKNYDARLEWLLRTPTVVRFLSLEPLLGPINMGLFGTCPKDWGIGCRPVGDLLDWVIVGGESGPHARPCQLEWIESIVEQCRQAEVPVFVKQLGTKPRYREVPYPLMKDPRKGGDMEDWPRNLRVRQLPEEVES